MDKNTDWIENYGFILVAFAHMTDWRLAEAEVKVINEKLEKMLSQSKQNYTKDDIAQRLVNILQRYQKLKNNSGSIMMDELINACESLKKEDWFDKLAATVVVQFLAEIAESDHKIEETEIQLLENISNTFGVTPPRL